MTDTNHDQSTALAADDVTTQEVSDETVVDSLESQADQEENPTRRISDSSVEHPKDVPTNPNTTANEDDSAEPQEGDEESDDDDAMVPLKKLREVRREAKNLRNRLKIAEDRIVDLESREGDEAIVRERDELKSQLESLVSQNRQTKLEGLVTKAAESSSAIQPEAIVHLIDSSKVEWEGESPKNVDALVADVKKNYPRLFGTSSKGNVGSRNERHSENEGLTPTARMRQAFEQN